MDALHEQQNKALLPCPFCGGTNLREFAVSNTGGCVRYVYCTQCNTSGPWGSFVQPRKYGTPIEAWNMRFAAYDAAKENEIRLTETTGRAAGIAHERVQPVTAGETAQHYAAKANGGWLPIESAPNEGELIIVGWHNFRGQWIAEVWAPAYLRSPRRIADPTHWQPLPPPPEQTP
jgi:hypothetical protein